MSETRVLTVTVSDDLHADRVHERIAACGVQPFRIDYDRFPRDYQLSLEMRGGRWSGALADLTSGDTIDIDSIGAVWMRKKTDFAFRSAELAAQERAFAEAEMQHLLLSFLYSLDCYFMSHPLALRAASWKGEQLRRAARLGFTVPPSLVTNDPAAAAAFLASEGDIVFKPLSSPTLAAEEVAPEDRVAGNLMTTRIGPDEAEMLDAVAELPSFFQRTIPKRHELRVTVIGGRAYAAAIHSQEDERTSVDCRDMSAPIRYERTQLPVEIERLCLALVESYGLTYGAIDLIVTPEGDHVFLEINPVGQYLYVEELVSELDLTGAVAACLIEQTRRSGR